MLKVGILGVGNIFCGTHYPQWELIDDIEIVAMCDIRPERLERFLNTRHYTSFDEMLKNEELDILDICLPTYLHTEYSLKAMNHGINVLCEKPISLNASDVKILYNTAEKNCVNFMVAHVLRFWPAYMALKKIYDNKIYGNILSGVMTRIQGQPRWSWDNWMADETRSGLVPFDLHIHDLDFLVYAFGTPKNKVVNRAKTDTQDYFNVTYQYDNFFVVTESSWYAARYPFNAQFRFQFEKAVVAYENWEFKVYLTSEEDDAITDLKAFLTDEECGDSYGNEIRYFVDCVKNNCEPEKVKAEELETVINILHSL